MKHVQPTVFFIVMMIFFSCQKSSFTPVKVTYQVKVASGNKVKIEYNSDQFFSTGSRPPIDWVSNGTTWYANHIATKEEDYYIKVTYVDAPKTEDNFRVDVFFNDTSEVAKSINDTVVPVVELSGRVTN